MDENKGICPSCGSVVTELNPGAQETEELTEDFNLDDYKDYLIDNDDAGKTEKNEEEPVEEKVEEPVEEKVEEAIEEKAEEIREEKDDSFSIKPVSFDEEDDEPEEEEEAPSFKIITDKPVEEAQEEIKDAFEEEAEEKEEESEEEEEAPSFKIITDKPIEEAEEEETEEPAEEITDDVFEEAEEKEEESEEEEEAPSFKIITDKPIEEEKEEETEEPAEEITDDVFEEAEEKEEEKSEEPVEETVEETEEKDGGFVFITDEEPAGDEEPENDEEKAEEPVQASESGFTFETIVDDGDDEAPDYESSFVFVTDEGEKPAEEEKPKAADTGSDLSMTERIRKYQIIPDSHAVEDEESPKPSKTKESRFSKIKESKHSKAKEPKEPEELNEAQTPEPINEIKTDSEQPSFGGSNQPVIKMQKITVGKRRKKGLLKILIPAIIIFVVAVAAIIILTNSSLKEKVTSLFNKEPAEQTEVVGNVSLKWVSGKKYDSRFDVLKIDQKELKTLIEKSLKENCTSEYDKLSEHYFGAVNGTDNYAGYINNAGIGIIFEYTPTDNLIKSIYVVADISSDPNSAETRICEYTACVLNALGEIKELNYKNLGIYAASIKLNSFKSIATHTRYNNFIISKYLQGNNSMLIINHGSNSTIKKFAESEVLDLVNCADEKYLKEEYTEPTTAEPETVEVTEYEEAVIYEVKTAGDPLRIRKEPNTDSEVLGTFDNGTQIEVFGITDDWAKIMYNEQEAWLAAKFLVKVEPEE